MDQVLVGGDGAYMKVLVVNSKSPRHSTGGAEFSSAQIATDIARLGHDVVFASLAEAGSAPADIIQDGVRYTEVVSHAPLLDRRSLRGPARIVRRLRREIETAKQETQQRRQSDPDRLVEQAMGRLKVLPAGDDQQVKAFLQTSVDHVDVWTEKTGSGTKARYSLARGEIHFVSPTEQEV